MEIPVITVRHLSKKYCMGKPLPVKGKKKFSFPSGWWGRWLKQRRSGVEMLRDDEFWALQDINFDVYKGEKLGIIGRNGAGKTTLLKILSRLAAPTLGEARIRGRVTSLLGVGTGFNVNMTGRENIFLEATLHGYSRSEIQARFDEIVEFSGVGKFINLPVKHYSSGMHSRLAFAVAAHLEPDILMLDEVLSVGDMAFQKKCLQKVDVMTGGGRTVLFVSHNMGDIVRFCDKVIWLEEGRIADMGPVKEITAAYAKRMLNLQASYTPPKKQAEKSLPGSEPGEMVHPEAPGCQLLGFEVKDASGQSKEVFFRHEPIYVHVVYRVLRDDIPLLVNVHLLKDETQVFTCHDTRIFKAPRLATCQARMEIPANLLNTGLFHFSLGIVTPTRPLIKHVKIESIASIQVVENFQIDEVMCASGNYQGVIHPQLAWDFSIIN